MLRHLIFLADDFINTVLMFVCKCSEFIIEENKRFKK